MIADHQIAARITLSLIDYSRSRGARRRRRLRVIRIAVLTLAIIAILVWLVVRRA